VRGRRYDEAAEYDVREYALEEYLRRFQVFILSTQGLGLEPGAGMGGVGVEMGGMGGGLGGLLGGMM
jgi:hypothetical protein